MARTRQVLFADTTWTAPAGVNRVNVYVNPVEAFYANKRIAMSNGAAMVIDAYQNCWAWGSNSSFLLGVGSSTVQFSSPQKVVGNLRFQALQPSTGSGVTQFLDIGGVLYSAGSSTQGAMGNGLNTSFSSPINVIGDLKFTQLVNMNQPWSNQWSIGAIDGYSRLWTWGTNVSGCLGQNTSAGVATSSPVQVVGGLQFQMVAFGKDGGGFSSAAALDLQGNCWCWGANNSGQAGQNSTAVAAYSSPVQVVGNVKFQFIWEAANFSNGNTVFGLDFSNNLWSWGQNTNNGQLGQNLSPATITGVSSPVQVVGGIKFTTQMAFSGANGGSVYALDTNGNCWAWGGNTNGQLGDGTILSRSSPVQVIGGLVFRRIVANGAAGVYGVTNNDQLFAWGSNNQGQLGNGNIVNQSSPVQVVGGLKWSQFICGDYSSTNPCFIGADVMGTLWAFGNNGFGQLGNASVASTSSPVQVLGNIPFFPFSYQNDYSLDVTPGVAYDVKVNAMFARFGNQYLSGFAQSLVIEFEQ